MSVSSTTLLAGKLLGVASAGLTQFLVWSVSLFGVSVFAAGPLAGTFTMPEITPLMLVSFVLFFVLGFLFYAALYAAIGSAVNTVQEAQEAPQSGVAGKLCLAKESRQLPFCRLLIPIGLRASGAEGRPIRHRIPGEYPQSLGFPVLLPIIVAMVSFPAVLEAPDGALAVTISMIPGMSPLIMFLRIVVLTPPLWQIAVSIALLGLGIVGVVWVAARVYRVGILMYGKKPTFPELVKWVRHA